MYRSSNVRSAKLFPESKTRCGANAVRAKLRLRRRSSLISKRKCGSRLSASAAAANFGGANWRQILIKLQEIIPTPGYLINSPSPTRSHSASWKFTTAPRLRSSARKIAIFFESRRFFPAGWGSRGIAFGSDLPHTDWEKRIEHALATLNLVPTIAAVS